MNKDKVLDSYLGEYIDERCPICGSTLLADKHGTKWCSLAGCSWSNDEGLTAFIEGLGQ